MNNRFTTHHWVEWFHDRDKSGGQHFAGSGHNIIPKTEVVPKLVWRKKLFFVVYSSLAVRYSRPNVCFTSATQWQTADGDEAGAAWCLQKSVTIPTWTTSTDTATWCFARPIISARSLSAGCNSLTEAYQDIRLPIWKHGGIKMSETFTPTFSPYL